MSSLTAKIKLAAILGYRGIRTWPSHPFHFWTIRDCHLREHFTGVYFSVTAVFTWEGTRSTARTRKCQLPVFIHFGGGGENGIQLREINHSASMA